MSQPNSPEGFEDVGLEEEQPVATQPQPRRTEVPTQKQKTSVYTVMLIVSFISIVIACILLYWEVTLWGPYPWWNTSDGRPNLSQLSRPAEFQEIRSLV